ncbi:sensory histidine kinase AtoS [Ruminiclostridium hungatei]|uniref:Sensory histidine kinase AtoS n=1 Tax=Ruminiclostridium hungatei TaxID=48256 RepID=A0A1V4SFD7_RUMHU|nr:ATP-binding protein [Ruminiclostridium hungatei]OPX42580.1 sensory histidine kinase AtoS [Ruminiclostridium hungatei]
MRDLSLHILDIVQNSINAKATSITVSMEQRYTAVQRKKILELKIGDNGTGIDHQLLGRVEDPFITTRTTRKVGLGIPLLKESAKKCEGSFYVKSHKNVGTEISAAFSINHIDRLPIGDVGETMITLILSNPQIRFILFLTSEKGNFRLDTEEAAKSFKGVTGTEYEYINWLKEFIDDGIKNIFGGVLNEVDS